MSTKFKDLKKVLIVTSAQPTANPRMKKEAISLNESGYYVTVLYTPISPWADTFDDNLFKLQNNIRWIQIGFHARKQPILYQLALFRQRFYKVVYYLGGDINGAALKSMVLFSQELRRKAKSIKADLYIGHNLGSFPAIVSASKKFKSPCIYDFEDFHRGEGQENLLHFRKVISIENCYVKYLSAAISSSPLIEIAYHNLFPNLPFQTVLNCFSQDLKNYKNNLIPDLPLKLFWFSQTIGKNRGIEEVIIAMGRLKHCQIKLTLLGNISEDQKNEFINLAINNRINSTSLIFLPTVSEYELVRISSQHHIGLATEVSNIINRDICLTNKLFIYLLAGNAIIYSNTKAQSVFMHKLEVGLLYNQNNIESIVDCLQFHYLNPDILRLHSINATKIANSKYNWNNEFTKLNSFINNIILKHQA